MGQGGYLTLVNLTPYKFVKTHQHQYQMNHWKLPDVVPPGGSTKSYVEWDEGIFHVRTDDGAEANYALEGTNRHFQVQARATKNSGDFHPHLQVDLQNVSWNDPDIAPIPPQSSIVDLGWEHDGNVTFTLLGQIVGPLNAANHPVPVTLSRSQLAQLGQSLLAANASAPTSEQSAHDMFQQAAGQLFGEGEYIVPARHRAAQKLPALRGDDPATYWLRRWMYTFGRKLMGLRIDELSIPGTHDSASYDMVSWISNPWTKTQNLNIEQQLQAGARALDLRVGLQTDKSGNDRFLMVHEDWRTEINVDQMLDQVLAFCRNESMEIVILDFHRFTTLHGTWTDDEFASLMSLVKTKLGSLLIPVSDQGKTLGELWLKPGRVIVAWNRDGRDPAFWPGVAQGWYDKSDRGELQKAIGEDLQKPHSGLWSECAILTQSAFHPIQNLEPDLSHWFSPAGEWASKVCIVSCDFLEETQLAQSLITASVIKGFHRNSGR